MTHVRVSGIHQHHTHHRKDSDSGGEAQENNVNWGQIFHAIKPQQFECHLVWHGAVDNLKLFAHDAVLPHKISH
jgi:hypothetical protein